jgi:hypothetical protein
MSRIRANNITNGAGTGAPIFPNGAVINGIATITANVSLNASELTVGTGNTINGTTDNTLRFLTNGTERLRITSGGNIGIGTNTISDFVDILYGQDAENIVVVRGADNTSEYAAIGVNGSNAVITGGGTGSTSTGIVFRTAASGTETERVRISSDGQIGLGGANYGNDNQVLTSTGNASAPEWRGVNVAFFGQQDASHNVSNQSYTTIINLGNSPINIAGWDESNGLFTIQEGQAGTWYFFGSAGIDDIQGNDFVRAGISKNDADPTWVVETRADDSAGNRIEGGNSVTGILTAAVGDTFSIKAYHNEGSSEPTEPNRCWFGGFRLSV